MDRHYSNRSSAHSTTELQLIGALSRIEKSQKIAQMVSVTDLSFTNKNGGLREAEDRGRGFLSLFFSIHNFLQFVANM